MARSIRLGFHVPFFLAAAFAAATPAQAGDVSVQLDSGAGFSVKNSTGAIERLRVDEDTGNVSRNGALFVHTTGASNLFVGPGAGNTSTSGAGHNAAFGPGALYSNTTGYGNSAFGQAALRSDTAGEWNSAVGTHALYSNTTGYGNSAFGYDALDSNTTGTMNSAFGTAALHYNTGIFNSAFGGFALFDTTTGRYNTAVGNGALKNSTTGFSNVAVGNYAGSAQSTGHGNIYLANIGVAAENNTIRIGCPVALCGASTPHARAFVAGIRGATTGVADAIPVLIDSAGQLGTVSSSRSVKKDIQDMGDTTARLLDLRPVTFRYKQEQTLRSGGEVPPEYGLIAEEVAEVLPDLVVYDEAGKPFTVKYHELPAMLLNEAKKDHRAIGEQQRKIDEQAAVIEAQRHENEAQQREIAALTSRLGRIETQVSAAPH